MLDSAGEELSPRSLRSLTAPRPSRPTGGQRGCGISVCSLSFSCNFLVVCIHCFLKINHFPTLRVWVKSNVNELCRSPLEVDATGRPLGVALWAVLRDAFAVGRPGLPCQLVRGPACNTVVERWRVWPVSSSQWGRPCTSPCSLTSSSLPSILSPEQLKGISIATSTRGMTLFNFFPASALLLCTGRWALSSYQRVAAPHLPHKTVYTALLFWLSKDFFEDSPTRKGHTQGDTAVQKADPSAPTQPVSTLHSVLC